MDNYEKTIKDNKIKVENFKKELKELMVKHNFGKHESDNYDGEENYCGTDVYFTINGEIWFGETISEILDECV